MEETDIKYVELKIIGLEFIKLVRRYYGGETADALSEAIKTVMPDYSNDLLLRALLLNTNQAFVTVKIPPHTSSSNFAVTFVKTIRSYSELFFSDAIDIYNQACTRPTKIPVDNPIDAIQLQRDLKDLGCEIYE